MEWISSLLVLGIIFGATGKEFAKPEIRLIQRAPDVTTSTTTENPISVLNKTATENLQWILSKYSQQCNNNVELSLWLDQVKEALKFDSSPTSINMKISVYSKFQDYDKQRLTFEKLIDDRINYLNDILPTLEPNSQCSKTYLEQKKALKAAKQLDNIVKSKILAQNSIDCTPETDFDLYYNY
ncbi:uncharacterized protein LOC108037020 [Drosophila rhopaloa]|uniref:Uncharacterized protein LOC108037020 n=1 Tax=Drosophila rhopaloa TaxID=1041015 RepID=A0A6P4E600_DRORH|nr:uncharacterized protein LOC108037020 [Drosophila rhopaloa]